MSTYRVCVLDFQGHLLFSRIVACGDDLDALDEAERECASHPVEVWRDQRLVARLKPGNAPLEPTDRTCL